MDTSKVKLPGFNLKQRKAGLVLLDRVLKLTLPLQSNQGD